MCSNLSRRALVSLRSSWRPADESSATSRFSGVGRKSFVRLSVGTYSGQPPPTPPPPACCAGVFVASAAGADSASSVLTSTYSSARDTWWGGVGGGVSEWSCGHWFGASWTDRTCCESVFGSRERAVDVGNGHAIVRMQQPTQSARSGLRGGAGHEWMSHVRALLWAKLVAPPLRVAVGGWPLWWLPHGTTRCGLCLPSCQPLHAAMNCERIHVS
jgi:hypothetical protein